MFVHVLAKTKTKTKNGENSQSYASQIERICESFNSSFLKKLVEITKLRNTKPVEVESIGLKSSNEKEKKGVEKKKIKYYIIKFLQYQTKLFLEYQTLRTILYC